MSTTILILGGVGLFLLGMTVMTEGLKALAGSSLCTVLGKAAATPLSGAFWGAVVMPGRRRAPKSTSRERWETLKVSRKGAAWLTASPA
jgi:Na+/Pi-cotransporter